MLPVGHMDFYPNGGSNQPGCPRQSFMNIITEEYEDGTYGTMHKRPTDSLIMQTGFSYKQNFFSFNFVNNWTQSFNINTCFHLIDTIYFHWLQVVTFCLCRDRQYHKLQPQSFHFPLHGIHQLPLCI